MSAAAAAALKQSQSMQKEEQERRQRAGALEEETGKRAAAGEIQQPAAKAAELCLKSVTRSSVCPSVAHRRRPTATDGDRAIAVALQLAVRTHAGRMCESEPEPRKSPSRLEKISIVGDYSLRVYHLA